MRLWTWIVAKLRRPPDFIVGGTERPYLLRWWLIPRNRWLNVYLHKFVRDDDDRSLHDHPWRSLSIVLRGGYYDLTHGPDGTLCRRWYGPGAVVARSATAAHRVELLRRAEPFASGPTMRIDRLVEIPAWTLFITGPRVREWGFWCPQGWVPWQQFVSRDDGGAVGKGCDQ